MTASADVASANIVGYQNVKVPYNKSLVTATFKNVNGEKLKLSQIKVLNDKGQEFTTGLGTSCDGSVTIQKLTPASGRYAATYAYYWPGSGTKVGWCDINGVPVTSQNDVVFENGEAMLVVNTWDVFTRNKNVYFQCSGEVDLIGENAIPYNKSLSGNALPRSIDLTELRVLNNERKEFTTGLGTSCDGSVTIQKLTPSTGKYAATYAYYWPGSGTKVGWCDINGRPVAVGDVVFEPGEAMLVVNTWDVFTRNKPVYFDLPDPLTPMPVPEEK